MAKLTANTITDEQIRELRSSLSAACRESLEGAAWLAARHLMTDCDIALGYRAPADRNSKPYARARCAEYLNARAKGGA